MWIRWKFKIGSRKSPFKFELKKIYFINFARIEKEIDKRKYEKKGLQSKQKADRVHLLMKSEIKMKKKTRAR